MAKNSKKRGAGGKIAVGAVALALLGGAGYFGLGGGSGLGVFNRAEPVMSEVSPAQEAAATATPEMDVIELEPNPSEIRISESEIYLAGEMVSLETLKNQLLSTHVETTIWEIKDDHAIKSTYDAVKALLNELDMPFVER